MFTIEKIGRNTRPYYVFEDGEFYAMFKTRRIAEGAIASAIENREQAAKNELANRVERLTRATAYIETRADRKAAQPEFNF